MIRLMKWLKLKNILRYHMVKCLYKCDQSNASTVVSQDVIMDYIPTYLNWSGHHQCIQSPVSNSLNVDFCFMFKSFLLLEDLRDAATIVIIIHHRAELQVLLQIPFSHPCKQSSDTYITGSVNTIDTLNCTYCLFTGSLCFVFMLFTSSYCLLHCHYSLVVDFVVGLH